MPKERPFIPSIPLTGKYHIISAADRRSETELIFILTLHHGLEGYRVVEIPLSVLNFGHGINTSPPFRFENTVLEIYSAGQFNAPTIRNPEEEELNEIDAPPEGPVARDANE